MTLLFHFRALDYAKQTLFKENNEIGFEPIYGLVSVTGGSLMAINHGLVNGGSEVTFWLD